MEITIRHKAQGWLACSTWSRARAEEWLASFDPAMCVDKTLRAEAFEIVDCQATTPADLFAGALLMHRPREATVHLEHREHPRAQHGAVLARYSFDQRLDLVEVAVVYTSNEIPARFCTHTTQWH